MDAGGIIAAMCSRYASCKTYRDSGCVEGGQGVMSFRTAFVRNGRFYFGWSAAGRSTQQADNAVWSTADGECFSSHSWMNGQRLERELSLAVAGATGVSQGVAHYVPVLLMPELGGRSFATLENSELVGEEMIGDMACAHLTATDNKCSDNLWIRLSDYALVKYERIDTLDAKEMQTMLERIEKTFTDPECLRSAREVLQPVETLNGELKADHMAAMLESIAANPKAYMEQLSTGFKMLSPRDTVTTVTWGSVIFDSDVEDNAFER